MNIIQKKVKTFFSLAREGKGSDIIHALVRNFLRVDKYSFVELDLDTFVPERFKARIPIEYKIATSDEMDRLFNSWPDSQEEYTRHHEVYYKWGFRTCFLFIHRDTGEIVHLMFLLTSEDLSNIRRFLPMQIYGCLRSDREAFVEWTYTFSKYRWRGIAIEALEHVLSYCKEKGFRKIFSHMSVSNINSVQLLQRIGFVQDATITQLRLARQNKHAGIYFRRRVKDE